jgi:hypothetical protein
MFNREGRTPTHGYEATPEAAMVAFAKSWRREWPHSAHDLGIHCLSAQPGLSSARARRAYCSPWALARAH